MDVLPRYENLCNRGGRAIAHDRRKIASGVGAWTAGPLGPARLFRPASCKLAQARRSDVKRMLAAALVCVAVSLVSAQPPRPAALAIEGATLIDGNGGAPVA